MLQRYILFWLLLSSGAACFWPEFSTGTDPFLRLGSPAINVLIVAVMFCVGALLPPDEVNQLGRKWPTVLIGTAVQYSAMPLLAWLAVIVFRPEPELATGIMIVGCVPGAMASNVLTLTARGNVSYSVCLTTAATLLSPIVVPLALQLTLGRDVKYEAADAVRIMLLQIVLPVLAGHGLARMSSAFREAAAFVGPTAANLAILTIIAIAVALKRDDVRAASLAIVLPLLAVNALGYVTGYAAGRTLRLPEPMRRALTLEVGMQNAGAGTALAIQLFGAHSAAIIPCVVYTFGCMFTGTLLAMIWNRIPPETKARDGIDSELTGSKR